MRTKTDILRLAVAGCAATGLIWCASIVQAGETVGPGGETATPSSALTLADAEVAKLKEGKYTAALLWHTSSDFVNAVTAGATDEFNRLGMTVVAQTDAGFDAAKQKSDVETILAKKPSAILALPLDPVTSAEAFKPAVAAGVKIVLLSNKPRTSFRARTTSRLSPTTFSRWASTPQMRWPCRSATKAKLDISITMPSTT